MKKDPINENLTRESNKENPTRESNKEHLRENLREINKINSRDNTIKYDKYSNTKINLPIKNKKDDEDPNFNTKGFKFR